jgi:hypothetical protein
MRRHVPGAQQSDLDQAGVGLLVLHVVSACDRVDEIARIGQREIVVELIGR